MKQQEKTNVMRLLDQKGVAYRSHTYEPDPTRTGEEIARLLGETPESVFKTLVTVGRSGEHYVFVIPVVAELDLKKAAKAVDEKAVEMIRQKELLPLTGYVHGGCSPLGMKKPFVTVMDESAILHDTICVSAGRVGFQVQLDPLTLAELVPCELMDVTK